MKLEISKEEYLRHAALEGDAAIGAGKLALDLPPLRLRVIDNDKDEISVTLDGVEIRAWSYSHIQEQFWKMQMAREFVEGYYQATGAAILP